MNFQKARIWSGGAKMLHLRSAAAILTLTAFYVSSATEASAAIVNFKNEISGTAFRDGMAVGTFDAELHYNLRDRFVNAFGRPRPGTGGGDRFPDKMGVQCVSGLQNNGVDCGDAPDGTANAYQIWGADPTSNFAANPAGRFGRAEYSPFGAFQDEYYMMRTLNLTSGPTVGTFTEREEIEKITVVNNTVVNNIERNFSVFHDSVIVEGSSGGAVPFR